MTDTQHERLINHLKALVKQYEIRQGSGDPLELDRAWNVIKNFLKLNPAEYTFALGWAEWWVGV